ANKWGLGVALRVRKAANVALSTARYSKLPGQRDGEADAFRHAFWNALMVKKVGYYPAADFATAHETGRGYNDPERNEYDPVAVKMDLHNNEAGRIIALAILSSNPKATDQQLADAIEQARSEGYFKVIKTDVFIINQRKIEIAVNRKGIPVIPRAETALINTFLEAGYSVDTNTKNKILIDSGSNSTSGDPVVNY